MAQVPRDQNRIPTLLATSNADGSTPLSVYANASTKAILVLDAQTGSDSSDGIADHDDNRIPVLIAVSSADGVTPVEVYVDSATNKLLVDSN